MTHRAKSMAHSVNQICNHEEENSMIRKRLIFGIFFGLMVSWICVQQLFPADLE